MRLVVRAATGLALVAGTLGGGASAVSPAPEGLPPGIPDAARTEPPALPTPQAWPLGEPFPRTSGFGRVAGGALGWTDFLYDDHGALGPETGQYVTPLHPPYGGYGYPDERAAGNGADVFRIGVGLGDDATYWRVDWNTLVDVAVPAALFTMDETAGDRPTMDWPANAGVRSSGFDHALLVTGSGAWVVDPLTGAHTHVADAGGAHHVDTEARSFVVRLPRTVLDVAGTWRVRMVAGLAADDGAAFADLGPAEGALPGQPNVYNVAFRGHEQEPLETNFWREATQAEALTNGDVTPFAADVDWDALAGGEREPEPSPSGWTNRWYVSSVEPGQGVVDRDGPSDLSPNFRGRVQPYGLYVPTGYDPAAPAPLTLLLHSLGTQHNQYGSLNADFVAGACEERGSICVSPLGRGPDLWWFDEAELDVFEVWGDVARSFALDPDRTVLSGFSMGGYGTYRLGLTYPELFAAAVVLAGPPTCGIRVAPGSDVPADPSAPACVESADTTPLVPNARWLPTFIAHGGVDELVPAQGPVLQAEAYRDEGYRYRFELYPAEGHVAYAVKGRFPTAVAFMARGHVRERAPGRVTLGWYPSTARHDLGLGPGGGWWVRDVAARDTAPGARLAIEARSHALPDRRVSTTVERGPVVPPDPSPGTFTEQRWDLAAPLPARGEVDLDVSNVAALRLRLDEAGFDARDEGLVRAASDGETRLVLAGLRPGARVMLDGAVASVADSTGSAVVALPAGETRVAWAGGRGTGERGAVPGPVAATPATGGGLGAGLVLLLAAAAVRGGLRRRHRTAR